MFAIAHPLSPATLGLRAAGVVVVTRSAIAGSRPGHRSSLLGFVLNLFLKAGDEQGLVPDGWDGSRAAPFVANFVVVVLVAPVVEELTFRGLGLAVVGDAVGVVPAILITGLAFGLAHGLVVALPILAALWCHPCGRAREDRQPLPRDPPPRDVQRPCAHRRRDDRRSAVSDRFDELRAEITANDERIVEAVNRRLDLVAELWEIKRERGLGQLDAGREQALLEALAQANSGPLGEDGLEELVTELLALTRRELGRRG